MATGFIQSIESGDHPHCPAIGGGGAKTGKAALGIHGPSADMASEVLVINFILEILVNNVDTTQTNFVTETGIK